jgi:hypothetical protein
MTYTFRAVVLVALLSPAAACGRNQQPTGPSSAAPQPAPSPAAPAAEVFNCQKTIDDASDLERTLYIASYPQTSLGEVDLGFTSKDTAGSYSVQLSVGVNGGTVAASTASISVAAARQRATAAFTFSPAINIPSGSSVRLTAARVSGPGELSYEGQTDASCGVIVTSGGGSTTQIVGPKLPVRIVS